MRKEREQGENRLEETERGEGESVSFVVPFRVSFLVFPPYVAIFSLSSYGRSSPHIFFPSVGKKETQKGDPDKRTVFQDDDGGSFQRHMGR